LFLPVKLLFGDGVSDLIDLIEVPGIGGYSCECLENSELFEEGPLGESGYQFEETHAETTH